MSKQKVVQVKATPEILGAVEEIRDRLRQGEVMPRPTASDAIRFGIQKGLDALREDAGELQRKLPV